MGLHSLGCSILLPAAQATVQPVLRHRSFRRPAGTLTMLVLFHVEGPAAVYPGIDVCSW